MKGVLRESSRVVQHIRPLQKLCFMVLSTTAVTAISIGTAYATPFSSWTTVVNNGDYLPGSATKTFFSYNQPSINDEGLVVFRARAKGSHGGEEGHEDEGGEGGHGGEKKSTSASDSIEETLESSGSSSSGSGGSGSGKGGGTIEGIFTRDISVGDSSILAVAVRRQNVPTPNGLEEESKKPVGTFNSFPSFPRIDASSDTLAFRGQSSPSYVAIDYKNDVINSGTSGLYAILDNTDELITGIRNIDPDGGISEYLVPGEGGRFEQFPGAPSPTTDPDTGNNLIAFKGNWTDTEGNGQTGVYYRDILANGNVVKIAERGDDIPKGALPAGNESFTFGSTAPPSAAAGKMVFTGLDNEDAPTAGGIFMADLKEDASLKTIAGFKTEVPSNFIPFSSVETSSLENNPPTLNAFGEGLSFDGRYVGFWAGWGDDTIKRDLTCKSDGKDKGCAGETKYVSKNQGIFLADTEADKLFLVAETGPTFEGQTDYFEDFLFWNFSGNPDGEEGLESAKWRSSAFLAVDGNDIVFKGLKANGEEGLYGALNVDVTDQFDYDNLFTILTLGMDGGLLDEMAEGLPIASLGIERDGFRNGNLAITASMTDGESNWSGVYVAPVPEPGTGVLFALGLGGLGFWRRRKA
ncbi:PEP-CTERM sorting domain-containing protein [Desulfosediminicola flagellatus]|uniref:PEP-CTERM sorting domain-containing protein n=1 Tax=Desulfosediminicola flagellatus TaxID=2569541 RepID=UPI0010AC10CF|nr:PEP-CTERM sorting domain-containing protein [Desulfosediminicola flagellatus]